VDRDRRGLHGDEAHGRDGPAPGAQRRAGAKRRMAKAGDFVSRWKAAPWAAPENRWPQPLSTWTGYGPIALSKAEARSSCDG